MMSKTIQCECGEITGEQCAWVGPVAETVQVEYMPEQHRGSHVAAGNSGSYPHNGARRVRVERGTCVDVVTHIWADGSMTDELDEWVSIVPESPREMGRKGGKVGGLAKGAAKVRGDANHYRALGAKGKAARDAKKEGK